ncbi:MAG: hypothetical protein WAN43_01190 [Rhodomicrobium sp.]
MNEIDRLTKEQRAAVARVIAKARKEPGQQSEDGGAWDAYAYQLGDGRIAWGVNAPHNIARGVVSGGRRP